MSKLKSIIIVTITGALLTIGFVGATSESGLKTDADEPVTNEQSKIAVKQNELKEKEAPVKTDNVKENLNEDKLKPQKDETKTETKIESKQEPEVDKEQEVKQEPKSKQEEKTKPEPKVEKKPEPKPEPKKSNAEIAKEVLAGKWGSGAERNRRLTNAGYDANSIQNEVNKSAPKPAPKPSQPKVNNSSNTSNNNTTTKPSKPSTSQPETKPVSYPANSVTVGNHSITWVYWKNVTGSAWWEGSESAATGVQDAVDKEANHWVNIMTQDNLFSINGSNNLWVAAHNYNSPGKQIYHIPKEVIITDRHGVSATYTYIDRAKTYNYIGTGTYGSNDVFIQTSRPDGVNILHYRLSKRLN